MCMKNPTAQNSIGETSHFPCVNYPKNFINQKVRENFLYRLFDHDSGWIFYLNVGDIVASLFITH